MARSVLIAVAGGVFTALGGCASEPRWVATPVPESGAVGENAREALKSRVAIATYNLANLDTPGFKPTIVLGHDEDGHLVMEIATERGTPVLSERPLDLCINGDGFFRVRGDEGCFYTRCGRFTRNGEGEVVMAVPPYLRLEPSITIPYETTGITIDAKGIVTITMAGYEDTAEVGQIQLTTFPSPGALKRVSTQLFQETPGTGPAVDFSPGVATSLLQNFYESSAVDPARELAAIERAYRQLPLWSWVASK